MSETKTDFKAGDVVRYETLSAPTHHCREGMAIAEARLDGVILFDTYWGTPGDRHLLTYAELKTAQVVFNLDDYDELTERQSVERWEMYKPTDRETVTSQHGLQVRWFVRKGAQPDLGTQIENAHEDVEKAEYEVRLAQSRVESARRELARLEADL